MSDHVWYGCAVLALCPPMAVLGSRRPGARVWTWFILLPMLLTLSWPILAVGWQGTELRRLQLETPQLVAFCLVLVMGLGNYCGTRFTISALLLGISLFGIAFSTSMHEHAWIDSRPTIRAWCTTVAVLSVILVKYSSPRIPRTRFDEVWFDFFDGFGIVWGRRIQDRVNFIVRSDHLPVELQLDGFTWPTDPNSKSASTLPNTDEMGVADRNVIEARLEHVLRWLLRRFVDSSWIDRRLGTKSESIPKSMTIDS